MIRGFKALDRVLRGDATRLPALREGTIDIPVWGLFVVLVLLAMGAGACTGVYAVITRYHSGTGVHTGWQQLAASAVKVPLLFGMTLLITFPSLYVFNALVGSKLSMASMLKLLIAAMCVMMAVLASLGPIVAFFAVSTTSYSFMKLLNVVAYSIAGFLGLSFLLQTLHRLSLAQMEVEEETEAQDVPTEVGTPQHVTGVPPPYPGGPGALERVKSRTVDPRVRTIFNIWVIVFGLVGAQMSWVLRPFVGNPGQPFTFFRKREAHFFKAVWDALVNLFSNG
jgi:hypothetical protein